MASPDQDNRRWAAGIIAQREAKRRFAAVGKVAFIVVITILVTLALTGHRVPPYCGQAWVCTESGVR